MTNKLRAHSLCVFLLVSLASATGKSASCEAAEGSCSPNVSSPLPDGDALSLVQLRASRKILPQLLEKYCPHKCTITNFKSGRRLYATKNVDKDTGVEGFGEDGLGATATGEIVGNQKWFIDVGVNESYVLKNVASSRRLYASEGHDGEDGIGAYAVLPIWDDQKWFIDGDGSGNFVFRNFLSGRTLYAMTGKDGKDGFGATLSNEVEPNQKWMIEPIEDPDSPDMEKELAFAVPFAWSYAPSLENATANASALGPNKWHLVKDAESCAEVGTQSPINIVTDAIVSRDHEKVRDLTLTTDGDCPAPNFMLTERTAEVDYTPEGCEKALRATWLGRDYYLAKFRYRSPSEHTWDGGYFPMEVQHVHHDGAGAANDNALIISVMIGEAPDSNQIDQVPSAFLLTVLKKIPDPGDDKTDNRFQEMRKTTKWNPYKSFIPNMAHGFLTYSGSLTVPPCNAGVTWILAKDIVKVPSSTIKMYRTMINANRPNQLAKFGTIIGDADEYKIPPWDPEAHVTDWDPTLECNTRPIQNLTGVNNPARVIDIVLPAPAIPVDTD